MVRCFSLDWQFVALVCLGAMVCVRSSDRD